MTDIATIRLEKHLTKSTHDSHVNGSLTVVWRDWDHLVEHEPKMIYVSTVNPGEIKGPHLHTMRNSYFVCIHGKVVFVIKDKAGNYVEVESSDEEPVLVFVPKDTPSAHMNMSNKESRVLALADLAWKPNDNEMLNVSFDDYDWEKLKSRLDK